MMSFSENVKKIKNSKAVSVIKKILESKFFPFISAAVILFGYYFSLDLLNIYYVAICILLVLLFLDDSTPIIGIFLFMNIILSKEHSPAININGSEYLYQPEVLSQIIAVVALLIVIVLIKIAIAIKNKQFKFSPMFFGLAVLFVALLLNGIFAEGYSYGYFLFGLAVAASFLGIFMYGACTITPNKETYEKIAWAFIAMSLTMIIELVVAYLTTEDLIVDGVIVRGRLTYGWGVYNTMGMLLTMSLPAAFYLAGRYKYGWLFTIYAIIVFIANWFSMSRQAMIGSTIIFVLCTIVLLVKGRNKLINFAVIIAVIAALAIYISVCWDQVSTLFSSILAALDTGSGRTILYEQALENFAKYPIFGIGFCSPETTDYAGELVFPLTYHDTILQFLGSCGAVGLFAYGLHRAQTVISYVKNITVERTFVALTILALLIVSIFDNHLFHFFPTLVYSMLVAVMVNSEKLKD